MKPIRAEELVQAVGGTLLFGDGASLITSVSTNSKEIEKGALFVPIIGERVDAHKFIDMALDAGAVATFTSKDIEEYKPGKVYIRVEDTVAALQKAAAWYRSLFSVKIVGITGSVGKTTTKEMIAAALETKYHVLKTKGNMNSQIGLPLMMFYLEEDTEVAVIEMGMSEVGEMRRLAEIARPDVAVMTNIGVSHIGQLGSQENIRKEKMNIIDCFSGEHVLFVNGEDVLLHEMEEICQKAKAGSLPDVALFDAETADRFANCHVKEYGVGAHCSFRAENIATAGDGQSFTYLSDGHREEITLAVLGIHNVYNATVALAVGELFGISPAQAKEGLAQYRPIAMRGQVFEHGGMKIIDDTYNASPDSMKSAVSVLLAMDQVKRRIVVFADVLELGEVSHACHYGVGEFISQAEEQGKKVDMVVTVGGEAREITRAIVDKGSDMIAQSFDTNEQAIHYLKENLQPGDAIIVKGSRGMHMEEVVTALKEM